MVRAAIYHARAERCAPPQFAARVRSAVKMDIDHLIRRLQSALEIEQASSQPWHESLFALVGQTPRGIWTVEARLLYDLQKVCVDHEREIYTVDLVEWALSWGRRPIKRQLPNQRDVLMLKHLRSAARRLAVVRISDDQRRQLALLVHEAIVRVEARLRQRLRPKIAAALDDGRTEAAEPARARGPKETGRGIAGPDLRARFPLDGRPARRDLAQQPETARSCRRPRLPARRSAAAGRPQAGPALDGVYRRGEIYLRWMQRLSSLGFGTRVGRFLTRFAVVPFGGAFVARGRRQ